jgi:high affinity Mn2+ porin
MFVRQTIDLGGETQKVAGDINQFGGSQTANRLVITVGKFSPSDIFDTISYAHDPRNDFLNWTLVDAGTFDYAADSWGYMSVVGFVNRGRMGRYDDAILLADATGTTPSTAAVRRYASRPGVNLNVEQQIMPNVGVFGRVGYADGNVEAYEFTDVDRTASLGASLNGKLWGREGDTIGIAGVVNEITSAHIAYLNAGGLGILVGDGQLPHPGPEQILETYYSLPIGSWKATADYQFIVNPAYNHDRGPVSVMTMRLHTQF